MAREERCDIIVIGGGSAAHEAAVAAREAGAERVVMLEKAPEFMRLRRRTTTSRLSLRNLTARPNPLRRISRVHHRPRRSRSQVCQLARLRNHRAHSFALV